jgi:hypothetical protein
LSPALRHALVLLAGAVMLAGAVELAWPWLQTRAETAREAQARQDLVELARAEEAFAASLGHTSFTTPYRLATLSRRHHRVPPLLPSRFLSRERYGYRFDFEGLPPAPDAPRGLEPRLGGFVYRAVPVGAPDRPVLTLHSARLQEIQTEEAAGRP